MMDPELLVPVYLFRTLKNKIKIVQKFYTRRALHLPYLFLHQIQGLTVLRIEYTPILVQHLEYPYSL